MADFNSEFKIDGQGVLDLAKENHTEIANTSGSVENVESNGSGSIKVTKTDGTSSNQTFEAGWADTVTATGLGPTGNQTVKVRINTSGGTLPSATLTVPYFTVDAQGRVTSKANRTIKITSSRYSNYYNYYNYSNYSNYSNCDCSP